MKRTILTLLLALVATIGTYAQHGPHAGEKKYPTHEEILSQKIAFFTQELDLTPEEAQQFWPVYNAGWKKAETVRREIRHRRTNQRPNGEILQGTANRGPDPGRNLRRGIKGAAGCKSCKSLHP